MCNYNFFLNISLLPLRLCRFCFGSSEEKEHLIQSQQIIDGTPKSIISWNIQELFLYSNTSKVNNIINYLDSFESDVICLQEVFEDKTKNAIIRSLSYKYHYHLITKTSKKFIVGEDSGLLVLSKYPIQYLSEVSLKGLTIPDSLANKTVMYFKIGNLNFATTHLQSEYQNISRVQLYEILKKSPIEKFILAGDLNNESVNEIVGIKQNNFQPTWENKIIDYILPIGYDVEIKTDVINIDLNNTSDHFPIIANLNELYP